MRLDKYSNPIFNEQDFIDAIYQGQVDSLPDIPVFVDRSEGIVQFEDILGRTFGNIDESWTIDDFDNALQSDWNMPREYKTLDIEKWIQSQVPPWDPYHTRVQEELTAFRERNMIDLLRWLKYFVDTCRSNNIVWGVGRGSSVASYILFLIGVHKIDSVKYNLDWQEFLR
jgi:DNA polymerase III alpha subunit